MDLSLQGSVGYCSDYGETSALTIFPVEDRRFLAVSTNVNLFSQ